MNNKKICFITCVNDDRKYEECLVYINNLDIPEGYEIDTISIREANSMTSAYNAAMKDTDAKYKVYLHQDTYIINKNFLYDILNTFDLDENIGMIGTVGAKTIPTNGVWWDSIHKCGQVYESHTGKMELLKFNEAKSPYEEVKAIDGLIMITQYDIPWREDIFNGWDFYDASQSIEFIISGYKVVVPKQSEVWCIHDCLLANIQDEYHKFRKIFLNEYSKNIFLNSFRNSDDKVYVNQHISPNKISEKLPLVSILIPTYNQTKYLQETLESAINQTYSNIEIIIGDDSTNDEVEKFIQPYLKEYSNISYFKNDRISMDYGIKNINQLLTRSNGEYINYLNHDDIFHPQKIEKMMNYFLNNSNLTLVTSVRQQIDEKGKKLPLNGAFTRLFDNDSLVSGYKMNRYMIMGLVNCIGEPTTALFKRKYINNGEVGYFNHKLFGCNVDVAMWATLLQYGDIMYISETLSYFRCHPEQNSKKPELFIKGVIDSYNLIIESYKLGIIINNDEYKMALQNWIKSFISSITNLIQNYEFKKEELIQIKDTYHSAIKEIFKNKNKNKLCPVCKEKLERFLPYQYKEHSSDYTYKYNIIGSDTENFSCPRCGSHDRERHIIKYFDALNIWKECIIGKNILHIAPENHVQKIISNLHTKEYICGDLYPVDKSTIKMDITDIQFEENHFDFIICNHVLEHIPDDLKAIKELYRVLKKGGYAVLQTPYSLNIDNVFEENSINTDELRKKYFGQLDHVRIYGKGLFDRIIMAGFKLKIVKNNELFSSKESKKYGFNDLEDLVLVFKE